MLTKCLLFGFILLFTVYAQDQPHYHALHGPRMSKRYSYQLKEYIINLDLGYEDRWREVLTERGHTLPILYDWFMNKSGIPEETINLINHTVLEAYDKEFAEETLAISKLVSLNYQQITILNFFYDAIVMCTSIVLQDANDNIYHGRNFDFPIASMLTNMLFHGKYMKNGKLLYEAITKLGEVGVLTGIKNGSFSFSIDTNINASLGPEALFVETKNTVLNMYKGILSHYEYEVNKKQGLLKQIKPELKYNPLLIARKAFETLTTYDELTNFLVNTPTFSQVYYIISGTQSGQGMVIEKKGTEPGRKTSLDPANGVWYVVQSNYLRNITDPENDNRRTAASTRLDSIGRDEITKEKLWNNVLIKYPVFNNDTIHTTMMRASTGYLVNVVWGFGNETNTAVTA